MVRLLYSQVHFGTKKTRNSGKGSIDMFGIPASNNVITPMAIMCHGLRRWSTSQPRGGYAMVRRFSPLFEATRRGEPSVSCRKARTFGDLVRRHRADLHEVGKRSDAC